ncbi:MAG: fibronectin type III domain-containing protein, partial [Crocinitomicaceae bacterium]|nr:fibronectin type III domain-containing protein [Crocinitomicaceae bacterium]
MKKLLSVCILVSIPFLLISQGVKISETQSNPVGSAMLEVESHSKGFLPPRMTKTERDAIQNPDQALTIFNTTTHCLEFFVGSSWQTVGCGCTGAPGQPSAISGDTSPCAGTVGLTYSVEGFSGINYTWSLPSGWIQTAGANSDMIQVTAGSNDGTISVIPGNACGFGTASNLSVALESPPAAPSTAAASDVTLNSFTANWLSVPGASAYLLDVSTVSNFSSFVNGYNGLNTGNTTSASITGLSGATTYYYRVRAVGTCGNGNYSDTRGVTTTTLLSFTNTGTTSWTAPPGVSTVEVLVVAGGGGGGYDRAGGGGAGGVIYNPSYTVIPGNNYTVTVGDGGAGRTNYSGAGYSGG